MATEKKNTAKGNEVPENIHAGHRKRKIKQYLKDGFGKGRPPHEILEVLLYFCIPRKDTNPIAGELIKRFGSLAGVFNAEPHELMQIDGIGENAAAFLNMMPEVFKVYRQDMLSHKKSFKSIEDVGEFLTENYKCATHEIFTVLSLDNRGRKISYDEISVGENNVVGVSMRKLAEIILRTGAVAVVLAHNHPHGVALPSGSDIAATKEVADLLRSIGVQFLDHIIVSDSDYISLAQSQKYRYLFENEKAAE